MPEFLLVFWQILKSTWQIWIFYLGIGLFLILVKYFLIWLKKWLDKRWLKKHKSLLEWKKLDYKKFERITAIIFEKLEYKTKVIGGAGDWGIDIIARRDEKKIFIQCKNMEKVSPNLIREFYGSVVDDLGEEAKGFFVTTGEFTQDGKEFAKTRKKPIELIDGLELEKIFKNKEEI
jgi:restriction system protein